MKLSLVLVILFNILVFVMSHHLEEFKKENNFSAGFQVEKVHKVCHLSLLKNTDKLPIEVDWRKHNKVTPVQDERKMYNLSWPFVVTALVEGQMTNMINLSEQFLIYNYNNVCGSPCQPIKVLHYITLDGVMTENLVEAKTGNFSHNKNLIKLKSFQYCTTNMISVEDLKILVAKSGPLMVGIEPVNSQSTGFANYNGGVYRCVPSQNNLVIERFFVIVGYGIDSKEGDYWIIKNSLGEQWGEAGYMRMAIKNSADCGITKVVTIASLKLDE